MARGVLVAAVFACSYALSACFFFDSTWGERKASQQRVAQHHAPAKLHATPAEGEAKAVGPMKVLRVRVYATPKHTAEVVEWQRRFQEALDDAGEVLGPTLGVRFELAGVRTWTPKVSEDDLRPMVDELAALDGATEVERVVGLAGSVPRFEMSYHNLGMGRVLGKHLVIRAMHDAREYEAIQRSLDELEEPERVKLYRARRRHKTASVLLHELGHGWGVPHEVARATIMHSGYESQVSGFSAAATGLMRLALLHELEPSASPDAEFAAAFIAHLERTKASWVPADREAVVAQLEPMRKPTRPTASTSAVKPDPASEKRFGAPEPSGGGSAPPEPAAAVAPADRETFARARKLYDGGDFAQAWTTAKPLFSAYPNDYAVQDLRCKLAMKHGGAWASMQAECEPLMRLVRGTPGAKEKR